jgi:hypothetical protein
MGPIEAYGDPRDGQVLIRDIGPELIVKKKTA